MDASRLGCQGRRWRWTAVGSARDASEPPVERLGAGPEVLVLIERGEGRAEQERIAGDSLAPRVVERVVEPIVHAHLAAPGELATQRLGGAAEQMCAADPR